MTKRNAKTTTNDTNATTPTNDTTNVVTVAMFARAHNINPKTIRAKLRRAARATDAAIAHEHRTSWHFTRDVANALRLDFDAATNATREFYAKRNNAA